MLFTPLHDRVLVRRIEEDEKTSGGLIIPETAKEKPQEGEVGDGAGNAGGGWSMRAVGSAEAGATSWLATAAAGLAHDADGCRAAE